MSVVDAAFVGAAPGGSEFAAPARSRRHALVALLYATLLLVYAYRNGARASVLAEETAMLVLPVTFWLIALVLWGTRLGRLRVDSGGVRWGYSFAGFRMATDKIVEARLYKDAVALRSRRSPTPWTLLARDWDRFDDLGRAIERLGVPSSRHDRRAPLYWRMQGYGRALDVLLVLNSLAGTFFVLAR